MPLMKNVYSLMSTFKTYQEAKEFAAKRLDDVTILSIAHPNGKKIMVHAVVSKEDLQEFADQ